MGFYPLWWNLIWFSIICIYHDFLSPTIRQLCNVTLKGLDIPTSYLPILSNSATFCFLVPPVFYNIPVTSFPLPFLTFLNLMFFSLLPNQITVLLMSTMYVPKKADTFPNHFLRVVFNNLPTWYFHLIFLDLIFFNFPAKVISMWSFLYCIVTVVDGHWSSLEPINKGVPQSLFYHPNFLYYSLVIFSAKPSALSTLMLMTLPTIFQHNLPGTEWLTERHHRTPNSDLPIMHEWGRVSLHLFYYA